MKNIRIDRSLAIIIVLTACIAVMQVVGVGVHSSKTENTDCSVDCYGELQKQATFSGQQK